MSELMPEVRDVWQCEKENTIFQIYRHILDENQSDYCYIVAKSGGVFFITTFVDSDWIVKNCKYLGKSKANIDQMFEVQNDNR